MPVMSSAGSGNNGITAIIPPVVVCENMGYDDEKLARTLAFSHLTTSYIKAFIGVLSPICSCAIAAGIGASAASEAIIQAKLARANIFISDFDGIIGSTADLTIRNLGKFCTKGMKDTD